jgi:hypothetical protein
MRRSITAWMCFAAAALGAPGGSGAATHGDLSSAPSHARAGAAGVEVLARARRVLLQVEPQRVATTVSAGLGQWVELGGVQPSDIVSGRRRIWLEVEEIGP